jgi:translation initiation factor IF-1
MSSSDNHILIVGLVVSAVHENYSVKTPDKMIKATLAGKLRFNKIQILENDYVQVRVSAYDLDNGQIVRRLNPKDLRDLTVEQRRALEIK